MGGGHREGPTASTGSSSRAGTLQAEPKMGHKVMGGQEITVGGWDRIEGMG